MQLIIAFSNAKRLITLSRSIGMLSFDGLWFYDICIGCNKGPTLTGFFSRQALFYNICCVRLLIAVSCFWSKVKDIFWLKLLSIVSLFNIHLWPIIKHLVFHRHSRLYTLIVSTYVFRRRDNFQAMRWVTHTVYWIVSHDNRQVMTLQNRNDVTIITVFCYVAFTELSPRKKINYSLVYIIPDGKTLYAG